MRHVISEAGRNVIRDAATQSPLVLHWLAGWLDGKGNVAGTGTLVITGAYIDADDTDEAQRATGKAAS